MTAEERLALLEDLKAREPAIVRRGRIAAWASVVLAACITAALLYVAYGELGRVESQVAAKQRELKNVNAELEEARKQVVATRTRLGAWQTVVSEIPKQELEAGFARASQKDPSVENILPRVYLQTPPGVEALQRAKELQRGLRQKGFVVPGIEVRPELVRETEVRYYRSAEAPQADKLAEALRSLGEQVGPPQHLKRYENSTAVRPNHYEVWLRGASGPRTDRSSRR